MLLSTCDFHEIWPSEGHTFRVGVKKINLRLQREAARHFGRKELLG